MVRCSPKRTHPSGTLLPLVVPVCIDDRSTHVCSSHQTQTTTACSCSNAVIARLRAVELYLLLFRPRLRGTGRLCCPSCWNSPTQRPHAPSDQQQNHLIATLIVAIQAVDSAAMDEIRSLTSFNVEPLIASEPEILDAIERYYSPL